MNDATLATIRRWADANAPRIQIVYLCEKPRKVVLYVIPVGERYDLELGGAMTRLETELAIQTRLETLQIPTRLIEDVIPNGSLIVWRFRPRRHGRPVIDAETAKGRPRPFGDDSDL